MGWGANPFDLPEGDPRREQNRSAKWWDKRENKTRDTKNPEKDGKPLSDNSSWWFKADDTVANKNKKKK